MDGEYPFVVKDGMKLELVSAERAYGKDALGNTIIPSAAHTGAPLTEEQVRKMAKTGTFEQPAAGEGPPHGVAPRPPPAAADETVETAPPPAKPKRRKRSSPSQQAAEPRAAQSATVPCVDYDDYMKMKELLGRAPKIPVLYSVDGTQIRGFVHKIIEGDAFIMTVYDLQYTLGSCTYPRNDRDAEVRIETEIDGVRRVFDVKSLGLLAVDRETMLEYVVYIKNVDTEED